MDVGRQRLRVVGHEHLQAADVLLEEERQAAVVRVRARADILLLVGRLVRRVVQQAQAVERGRVQRRKVSLRQPERQRKVLEQAQRQAVTLLRGPEGRVDVSARLSDKQADGHEQRRTSKKAPRACSLAASVGGSGCAAFLSAPNLQT